LILNITQIDTNKANGTNIAGEQLGAEFVTFQKLLQESDFVIVACPLTSETKHLFNEEAFALMKKSSILVNIARGGRIKMIKICIISIN